MPGLTVQLHPAKAGIALIQFPTELFRQASLSMRLLCSCSGFANVDIAIEVVELDLLAAAIDGSVNRLIDLYLEAPAL